MGPKQKPMKTRGTGQSFRRSETSAQRASQEKWEGRKGGGSKDGEKVTEFGKNGTGKGNVEVCEKGRHEGFDEQYGLTRAMGGGAGAAGRRNGRSTPESEKTVENPFGGERCAGNGIRAR